MFHSIILPLIVSSVAIYLTAAILPGITVKSFWYSIGIAIVLSLLNAIVKPILLFLSIPINILTFGIFTLVINAVIILIASAILKGFHVRNFWWAILFSLITTLITNIFYWFL